MHYSPHLTPLTPIILLRLTKLFRYLFVVLLLLPALVDAQSFRYQLEGQALLSPPGQLPFWLRANQHRSVPLPGPGLSLLGRMARDYDTTRHRLLDWGVALEGRANAATQTPRTNLLLIEGHAKVRLAMLELRAGRSRNQMGLVDTLLSSGSMAVSGNALGIPQVQLSIPEFYPIPFTRRWLAIKGSVAHGWVGVVPISNKRGSEAHTYFHQKSVYLRVGRPESTLRLYGGYNDQAFWGSERQIFESFILTDWQSFQSVLYGKNWAGSKVGNHVGTLDGGLELDLKNVRLFAYRQQIYDVGALYYLANVADGLTGISLTNKNSAPDKTLSWKKLLVEMVYTKHQGGKVGSTPTPSGSERYYNHYLYSQGYSYQMQALGNPLLTPAHEAESGQSSLPANYFINNRLWAVHTGLTGQLLGWEVQARATYSRNFGTYETSGQAYQGGGGKLVFPSAPAFIPVNQFSSLLSGMHYGPSTRYWGASLAWDQGGLLKPSVALLLRAGVRL